MHALDGDGRAAGVGRADAGAGGDCYKQTVARTWCDQVLDVLASMDEASSDCSTVSFTGRCTFEEQACCSCTGMLDLMDYREQAAETDWDPRCFAHTAFVMWMCVAQLA